MNHINYIQKTKERIVIIEINRPNHLNALNSELIIELETLLNKISLHLLEEDIESALFCIDKILTLNPLHEEANYLLNQINDYTN